MADGRACPGCQHPDTALVRDSSAVCTCRAAQGPRPQDAVLGSESPPSWLFDMRPNTGNGSPEHPLQTHHQQQQRRLVSIHDLAASDEEDESAPSQPSRRSTQSESQHAGHVSSNQQPVSLGHTPRSSSQQRLTSFATTDADWMFGIGAEMAAHDFDHVGPAIGEGHAYSTVQSQVMEPESSGPGWQVVQGGVRDGAAPSLDEQMVPYRLQPRRLPRS